MQWWRRFRFGVRAFRDRERLRKDLEEDLEGVLQTMIDEKTAEGMAPAQARREAILEFGHRGPIVEECHDQWGTRSLENLFKDIQLGFRKLIKSPGFTLVATLTLGLCIGANLSIFAVLDAIVVRALPFPHPERLVVVNNVYPGIGLDQGNASIQNYFERRQSIDAFESVAMIRERHEIIGPAGSYQRVQTAQVTPEFFQTLGVPMAMGRTFTEDEIDPNHMNYVVYDAAPIAVITDRFWKNYFNADPNVIGQTFLVNSGSFEGGVAITVIGVLPQDYRYLSSRAQIYRPIVSSWDRASLNRHSNMGQMIARLRPNHTQAEAQSQLAVLNAQMRETDSMGKAMAALGYHTTVRSLHADHVRAVRPVLLLLQAGGLCLLLIGAVNLAGLLLIRASSRLKETAVCKALGATRHRITSQILVDTLLLAIGGGAVGVVLSAIGIQLLKQLGTDALPMAREIVFDGRFALVSIFGSVALGLCLAFPIVWLNLRDKTNVHLQSESRGGTVSRGVQRLRHGLIVAQIAFAFVLLCDAGMLALSLKQTLQITPGFASEQIVTGEISVPWLDLRKETLPHNRLLEKLKALPGVTHAAVSTALPFTDEGAHQTRISVEGINHSSDVGLRAHPLAYVSPDYWRTMNIPLLRGRFFEENRLRDGVAVVDEAFARQYWPDGQAIGRAICLHAHFDFEPQYTIIGIVGNVKQNNLTEARFPGVVYIPDNGGMPRFRLIVRTQASAAAMIPSLQNAIAEVYPTLPLQKLNTMQTLIDETLVTRRSPAILAGLFAAVAVLLTSIGIYGALAFHVSQRRREIGLRIAMGARPEQIGRQFLSFGFRLFVAGALVGALGTWMTGRAMQHLLFETPPLHLPTLAATALLMGLVTLLACLFPATQAGRVNPAEVLQTV